jgi:hypothetical protein
MKGKDTTTKPAVPLALSATADESFRRLSGLLDRRERMIASLRALPAQIEQAHADVQTLRQQITDADIEFAGWDDTDLASHRREHEAKSVSLVDSLAKAEIEERRLQDRHSAMEPAIERLDDEIVAEIGIVRTEADDTLMQMIEAYEPEIERVAATLRDLLAKVAVIGAAYPGGACAHLMRDSYLPSLHAGYEFDAGARDYRPGNRLKIDEVQLAAARVEVAERLKPLSDVLKRAAGFSRYSPLIHNPKPPIGTGVLVEFSGPPPVPASELISR